MLFMCCNILIRKLLKCTQAHKSTSEMLQVIFQCVCVCDSVFLLKMHVIYESYALLFEDHRLLPEMIRPLSRAWHLLSTALLMKLNAMFFVAALICNEWFYNIRWPNFYHWMILEDLCEAQKSDIRICDSWNRNHSDNVSLDSLLC